MDFLTATYSDVWVVWLWLPWVVAAVFLVLLVKAACQNWRLLLRAYRAESDLRIANGFVKNHIEFEKDFADKERGLESAVVTLTAERDTLAARLAKYDRPKGAGGKFVRKG